MEWLNKAMKTIEPGTHRIYKMSFASVYVHYINKAERKGRTKAEVDQIILWLTGFTQKAFDAHL